MTRISGYDLFACPSCGHLHRKTSYSSISIYVPDAASSNERTCAQCHLTFDIEEFLKAGFVSLYSDEEKAKRYAWTLYSIGQGPRPETKPSEPFVSRCWLTVKALFTPKPPEPWEKYPPLV